MTMRDAHRLTIALLTAIAATTVAAGPAAASTAAGSVVHTGGASAGRGVQAGTAGAVIRGAGGAARGGLATADPPGGASAVGSPISVPRAGGGVDQLQLFAGDPIYPNTPGANLWYLLQGADHWVEVQCCIPVDIPPTVLAAEGADGRIEAFVTSRGGVSFIQPFFHDYQTSVGGPWQIDSVGSFNKNAFGGGGAPQLVRAGDGRLHFFAFDASWQIGHIGQSAPGAAWGPWQLLGAGPFAMPVTMIGTIVTEAPDGTLNLTAPMVGASACTATTQLAPGQSAWSAWVVDPAAPAYCPRHP